jgi:Divergent InlB B-repeat domain
LSQRRGVWGVGRAIGSLLAAGLICFVFAGTAAAAPPTNDDFANAQAITLDTSVSGSNFEATKEAGEPDHAGNAGGHSVWYSWTAPRTEAIGITLPCQFGTEFEVLMGVYTGSVVDALTPVASSQGFNTSCNPFSEAQQVEFEAQAGVEYKIAIDGKNGGTGFFSFEMQGAPANDDFADATTIAAEPPESVHGTNRRATAEPGEPDHAGEPADHSVWFDWTPAKSGPVIISTCESVGQIDSTLAVYTGSSLSALTLVASNDDALIAAAFPECKSTDSEVRIDAVAGTEYKIAVDGAGGTVGGFNLRFRGHPANDSFGTPTVLPTEPNTGTGQMTNKLATAEPGEPDHAGQPAEHSVWFSWTPSESGLVTASACPSPPEGVLETVTAVYTGSAVDLLTPVASSAGEPHLFCGREGSEAKFEATAGVTYLIAIDGKDGSEGNFQLDIEGASTNDSFARPQSLGSGISGFNGGDNRDATAEPGEPDHAGDSVGHSLWFTWTPTTSGPAMMSACPSGAFDGAPTIGVYTGSTVSALTPVAADGGGGAYCGQEASQVEIQAVAGTEYKIAVDATRGAGGVFSLQVQGAPANDDFAAPDVLPAEPTMAGGTTLFATKQPGEPNHAGDPGGHSVWFSWTPTKSGPVGIDACPGLTEGPFRSGGNLDTLLAVYTGESLDDLSEVTSGRAGAVAESVDCEGEAKGNTTQVQFDAVAGTTYRIAVDGAGGAEGPFTLGFERGATNDEFSAATTLEGGLPLYGSVDNRFATKQVGEPDHAGDPGGHSVWFDWTPTSSGPVWMSTCNTRGGLDPVIGVYTGATVDALAPVASNDNAPDAREQCSPTDSGVEVDAFAGTTYRIAVDGKGGTVGTTGLEIEGAPVDDDFEHAISLGATKSGTERVSNRFATVQPGEPQIAGVAGGHSIWFKWTAPRSGTYDIDTCGSAIDTMLGVYTGNAVNALTPVASNDEGGGECSPGSRVVFDATAGTVYRIAVDGKGGAVGSIDLHLDQAPGNDNFADAVAIQPGVGFWSAVTTLATAQSGEPAPAGHSVWFEWTPSVSGGTSIEACGVGFVPAIGVFTGDELASLAPVPSVDVDGECAKGTTIEFTAVVGTTYRIAIGGAEGGRVQLHLVPASGPLRLLTVRTGGAGSGAVSSEPDGIACAAACHYNVAIGTSLTLIAQPAPGSEFVEWSGGGCTGSGACAVNVKADSTVTAEFAPAGTEKEVEPITTPAEESKPPAEEGKPSQGSSVTTAPSSPPVQSPAAMPKRVKPLVCHKGFKKVGRKGKPTCVRKATPKKHAPPKRGKHTKR